MKTDREMAVLTRADSVFGMNFLRELASKGIKPYIICVEYTTFSKRIRMAKSLAKKIGWVDALRYNIKFWKPIFRRALSFGRRNPLPNYDGLAEKIVKCRDINDEVVVSALKTSGIKKVVLAQSGIIRKPILDLGKWVINCHPGRLPELRGVDVIRWALLERRAVEVTLHIVDSGIDTGKILKRQIVPIKDGDNWNMIEKRSIEKSLDLLLDAAIKGPSEYCNEITQEKNEGKQYYLMSFKEVQKLEKQWPEILSSYISGGSNEYK
ncbi:hypothetical protein JCM14036_06680 [Desulfotomaculum defluvii]